MAHAPAKVGAAEVFTSGVIIAPQNTPIRLTPFPDQTASTFQIDIVLDNDLESFSYISARQDEIYLVEWKMKWPGLAPVVHLLLDFAFSDEAAYKISMIVLLIGDENRYAVNFSYTIFKEAKA